MGMDDSQGKAQGLTIENPYVLSLGNKEMDHGLSYVAFSRSKVVTNIGIDGGITEAYSRLGETPPESFLTSVEAPDQQSAQALKGDGPGVTVSVSLDETFWNDVPADTTLFVFARQANVNSGPPLAVARFTASDMPLEIRLDDSMAMSPQNTISSVEKVMVTARLSPSNSVAASAGDWQGSLAAPAIVAVGDQTPLTLVINSLLIE
jgi:cytochrome c-type biogenesis protein CcmH